jgi:hypothetical protein
VVSNLDFESFEQRAQAALQASAESLDGATRSRLTQARHAALDAVKQRQSGTWRWLMPATGGVAAAVFAVMIAINSPHRDAAQLAVAGTVDDMEILTAEDSLEFYRDVDFYAWLDSVLDDETPAAKESEA